MIETSNILVNKLTLNIQRNAQIPEQRDIADIVKSLIFNRVCECLQTQIDWQTFIWGGAFSGKDGSVNGIAASARNQEGFAIWAACVNCKDESMPRRHWKYYFGIRQRSQAKLTLSYARCYCDHMAGSIIMAKPISTIRDPFPDIFFYTPGIQCMCGKRVYSNTAIELNKATLPDFVDSVQDNTRNIPVILITCPDYIVPEPLMDQLQGNAIIYWCDNAELISRLNMLLPPNMKTPWDSVHVFIPIVSPKPFHPIYTYDDIYRMGRKDFIAGLLQAHCRSMHSEERKAFLTVDDVIGIRAQYHIAQLTQQCKSQSAEISRLRTDAKEQLQIIKAVSDELEQFKSNSSEKQIQEYEEFLAASMAETDSLKKGISSLSERLFSTMGTGFRPDDTESIPILQELSHAIYTVLANASSRKQR